MAAEGAALRGAADVAMLTMTVVILVVQHCRRNEKAADDADSVGDGSDVDSGDVDSAGGAGGDGGNGYGRREWWMWREV
jgi:hypothetical protein